MKNLTLNSCEICKKNLSLRKFIDRYESFDKYIKQQLYAGEFFSSKLSRFQLVDYYCF